MTTLEPCDLHEISNCSICTGRDKAYDESLQDSTPDPDAPLPVIPGGPTIRALFSGTCAGCGRRWQPGAIIHRDREHDGWVLVGCCA